MNLKFILAALLGVAAVMETGAQTVLPDAPQPVTCQVMEDVNGRITKVDAPCSAPRNTWRTLPPWEAHHQGKKAGFFTVRTDANGPALRTNKQTVFSPTFLVTEGTMWGTGVADMKLNGCKGNAPCGSELYVDALVPLAVVALGHYALTRWICAACGAAGPALAFSIHTKGLVTGVYP